jgi:hypothetical protein
MVNTLISPDNQAAWLVKSLVLPSLKYPMALNCFVKPAALLAISDVMKYFSR